MITQTDDTTRGDISYEVGNLLYRQSRFEQAVSFLKLAYDAYVQQFGDNHPKALASLNNLAIAYRELGQLETALPLLEKALKLKRATMGEDHPSTLKSLSGLARTYNDLGQYGKAKDLNEQTLILRRAKLGDDHPGTIDTMSSLASNYAALGQHQKALALKEEVLKLRRAKFGVDDRDTLDAMHALVVTYNDLGQYAKAMAMGEETIKRKRAVLGDEHPATITSWISLAFTAAALGQHVVSVAIYEDILEVIRAKPNEDSQLVAVVMNNLAISYGYLGRHNKALMLNEQSLKLKRAKFGNEHPTTLDSMHNLANNYVDLGRLDLALNLIPDIVRASEKLRVLSGLNAELQQSIFIKYANDYQFYARWYASAGRRGDGFTLGDLGKARSLTDSIRAQIALRSLPLVDQEKLLSDEMRAKQLTFRIEELINTHSDAGALITLKKERDDLEADHVRLINKLKISNPKFAQLSTIKAAEPTDAKRLLSNDDVFVSYLVHGNDLTMGMKGLAQAFVLDQSGEAQWVDLGQINNHAKTVAAYRELISPSSSKSAQGQLVALKDGGYEWLQSGQVLPKDATVAAASPAQALPILQAYWHKTLIAPVLALAGPAKRWIISPDKDLALLPFDTLPENATSTLGQTRTITLVQSFAVYALLKQREAEYANLPRAKELFAMGNAVYSEGWAQSRGINRASGERGFAPRQERNAIAIEDGASTSQVLKPAAEQYALDRLYWKNLPGTAREIKTVSAVFAEAGKGAGSTKVDSYQGLDASEDKLQKLNQTGQLQDYRYMLFSAHGYLAQNPALSALVLSQQGNPAGIDGYVTAAEWPLYDLKSDLTVLSACDTGVGKTQAGESVMGLPYALFVAGNKNTILTLWPVDDDATAEFMRRFFGKLKAGARQSDALSQTKQEFMAHPQWSAPRYWAAFVLYGV